MKRDTKNEFVARKRSNSSTINFIALLAGMTTTIILVLMTWNHFNKPSDFEDIASVDTESSRDAQNKLINSEKFESELQSAESEELEVLLIRLDNWNRKASDPVKISENQKRAKVATALLQLPLHENQRIHAVRSKIEAYSAIYGIDFLGNLKTPDVGATLRATAQVHVNDSSSEIKRAAQLAIIKVDAFDFIKRSGDVDFEPTLDKIITILKDFPEDEFVISNIKLIISTISQYDRTQGIKVSRSLLTRANEFTTPGIAQFFRSISDSVALENSRIDQLYSNRWVNGDSGQRELYKKTLMLATDSTSGLEVLNRVAFVASWFEQEDQYERATHIYQVLQESADQRTNIDAALASKRLGSEGLARCGLVGQKLEFSDRLIAGEPITSKDVEQRIVVFIFWSNKDPKSIESLIQFHNDSQALVTKQVRVFAVCVDESFDNTIAKVAKAIPRFNIITRQKSSQTGGKSILSQVSVPFLPFAMIVDQVGVVKDCNVPLDELKTDTEYHVTRRFNGE